MWKSMNVEEKVKEIKDLPEAELNKELHKLNVQEFNQIINHLAGKILEEQDDSTKRS